MSAAERQAIADMAQCCEYRCGVAFDAAQRGCLESAQENLDWAEIHSLSAFFVAENAN